MAKQLVSRKNQWLLAIIWCVVLTTQVEADFLLRREHDSPSVGENERILIDRWLDRHPELNLFSDPVDTMYAGGTPLFNEVTGRLKDRYQYIVERHPNRPWRGGNEDGDKGQLGEEATVARSGG